MTRTWLLTSYRDDFTAEVMQVEAETMEQAVLAYPELAPRGEVMLALFQPEYVGTLHYEYIAENREGLLSVVREANRC